MAHLLIHTTDTSTEQWVEVKDLHDAREVWLNYVQDANAFHSRNLTPADMLGKCGLVTFRGKEIARVHFNGNVEDL